MIPLPPMPWCLTEGEGKGRDNLSSRMNRGQGWVIFSRIRFSYIVVQLVAIQLKAEVCSTLLLLILLLAACLAFRLPWI